MGTRIEIYKNEEWQALQLSNKTAIKYNAVINKIGKVASREISHTNTFDLPPTHQNIKTLGLNVFNPSDLAKAMNAKYVARYYVEDKLLQKGFIVINNTNGGSIKVNLIDEALDLTTKWGSMSYQDLLMSESIDIPADYVTAIDELKAYDMDKTDVLDLLSEVGTRGYNLCLFPHNLNIIGDDFQIDDNGVRVDNAFNPYQSRPIFSAKALFDLATESFGYTPTYDDTIDWDVVDKTFIVNNGLEKNAKGENGIQTKVGANIAFNGPYNVDYAGAESNFHSGYTLFNYPSTSSLKPNDVAGWVNPTSLVYYNYFFDVPNLDPWMSENSIYVPDVAAGNVGTITMRGVYGESVGTENQIVHMIWKNATPGGNIITSESTTIDVTPMASNAIEVVINKTLFDTVPAGADSLIGIMFSYGRSQLQVGLSQIRNMTVTETFLPEGVVAFDEQGQYLPDEVDLRYAAPSKSIKDILSGVMHKEGILMNVNSFDKTIKFFAYGEYQTQKESGNYYDWSDYLIRDGSFLHNTDYGKSFGRSNVIGLSSPYPGNTFIYSLENQGEDSKYKESVNNFVSQFSDIINVQEINNSLVPYFEYEHKGFGLVEQEGTLGTLSQQRFNGVTQGSLVGLPKLANVNYAILPSGVRQWYDLVDKAVRVNAKFLLPVDVVKNIDLSQPVYVEELGGFYIIEEIAEYVNGQQQVTVKLIKLIDNLLGDYDTGGAIDIAAGVTLVSTAYAPNNLVGPFNYGVYNVVNFANYTPISAEISYQKLTDNIDNGGVATGSPSVVDFTANLGSPYTNININLAASIPITAAEEGWYEIQVSADNAASEALSSNIEYAYLGDSSPPPAPSVSVYVDLFPTITPASGSEYMVFSYDNHTALPTSSVLTWQKWGYLTQVPLGIERTTTFPTNVSSGTQLVDFIDGAGFYHVTLTTNEGESEELFIGGHFIT
jgi:hypothetical protein